MRIPSSPYLLLVITMLCWAGNFVVGRSVHGDIPPVSMAFWRVLATTAVLLPLAGRELWAERAVVLRHWRLMTVLGVVGIAAYHASVYTALSMTTAINVSLVFAIVPVVIPIFSYLLDGERITARQMAGIAVSLGGVVAIITRADAAVLLGLRFNAGDLWMVLGMALWSLFAVLLQRSPARVPALALLLVLSSLGTVMLAPVYAWELAALGGFAVDAVNAASIAFVVVGGVIALTLWTHAVAKVGAAKAGLFTHLTPVFAVILAIVLLGETLQPYHVAGTSLIVFGILLTITVPRAARVRSGN
ncbi:MAG: DMT family transporter [Rhodospirillales bacterium]|jgi:drug/metabolite transporter (DMT)-like permease|nr:DMT family transporter [Rhodospirillales bacterium]MDP6774844.1 DMT family transporter [Rhodospirillales bacterium]